jgi:cysteinyl-tRNA synthetase
VGGQPFINPATASWRTSRLAELGVALEDTSEGTRWRRRV